jgi:hypothetical protein
MLSDIQQEAIIRCLTDLDRHTQHTDPWPGPPLLAAVCEEPVVGHPDPTARGVWVSPLPVPDEIWDHPDGPIAALRQASNDLNTPDVQAQLVDVPAAAGIRILAWVFRHSDITIVEDFGPQQVRFLDAVDIDDRSYILIHLPGHATGDVTVYVPGATDDNGAIELLRTLARDLRTG